MNQIENRCKERVEEKFEWLHFHIEMFPLMVSDVGRKKPSPSVSYERREGNLALLL